MRFFFILFYPLSLLYQFLFWVSQFKIKPFVLPHVLVISVGNISMGGTGKTPFVQYLVRYFKAKNKKYAITILSRGYKAKLSKVGAILRDGLSPHLYGDEPSEHKELFPDVQVIIGKNRKESFLKHNQVQSKFHIVILDDGFQHKQIHRDFDIVLLDANGPFGNGQTIPLGFLREPILHLRRANTIVFTKLTDQNKDKSIRAINILKQKQIPVPSYTSHFLANLVQIDLNTLKSNPVQLPVDQIRQTKVLDEDANDGYFLFTGVGNPKHVLETAESIIGKKINQHRFFPDHYEFEESVLGSIIGEVKQGTVLLTTEKDWVKVRTKKGFLEELRKRNIQIFVIKIEVVVNEKESFESMLAGLVSTYEAKNDLVSMN
ncbi:tetraacyldisaccharide 4'-kinase [Leptospira biflexa]|uniref:tetraacyldisaccharide 4'-kinase n=1 Tax=Leptospira biflexa TaxID=172 RepID=UPI0010842641|nr:tetraacyldisaccharide 4'-kinase [Leptospira biflexa]TGM35246.1 tetraacyldisaccharide 4'-kinase [Leptospira biflexa]TGM38319.1 tetraacyldisaccharide 4'-kinase [Leptospira biflexa]